jgi:hypothetical protein
MIIAAHIAEMSEYHSMQAYLEVVRASGKPVHTRRWRDLSAEIVAVETNALLTSDYRRHLGSTLRSAVLLSPDHAVYWVPRRITLPYFSISTAISVPEFLF